MPENVKGNLKFLCPYILIVFSVWKTLVYIRLGRAVQKAEQKPAYPNALYRLILLSQLLSYNSIYSDANK
jgi:hypothetical protein